MATTSHTTIADALYYLYAPKLREQLTMRNMFLKKVQRAEKFDIRGKAMYMKVHKGRATGSKWTDGGTTAGQTFPAGTASTFDEATLALKWCLGNVTVPREVMQVGMKGGAVVDILSRTLADFKETHQLTLNRFLYGTGAATVATCSATAATSQAVVTVDTTDYLEPGMVVDIIDVGDGTTENESSVVIQSINSATSITLTANVTTTLASGDYIVLEDSTTLAPHGLGTIFDNDNDYLNIDEGTNYFWQYNLVGESSDTNFDRKTLRQGVLACKNRGGGVFPDSLLSQDDILDGAMTQVLPDQRFAEGKFEGYWRSMNWRLFGKDVEWITDETCTENTLFGIVWKNLWLGELVPFSMVNINGQTMHLSSVSPSASATPVRFKNEVQILFEHLLNIGASRRNNMMKYRNIYGLYDSGATYPSMT